MAKPELRDHRKFLKLQRLTGEPRPHLMGYLECLWLRGYQTGNPLLGDAADVEAAAEYQGELGKFAAAAYEAGFLDRDENGQFSIHDLYEHAPRYARLRMARKGHSRAHVCAKTSEPRTRVRGSDEKRSACAPKTRTENLEPRTESQEQAKAKDIAAPPPAVETLATVRVRESDAIWDAIVAITGTDATIRSQAAHVGKVKKALLDAKPPYTAAEILSLPAVAEVHMTWAAGRVLTLGEVEKYIGLVRTRAPTIGASQRAVPGSRGETRTDYAKRTLQTILENQKCKPLEPSSPQSLPN